jgi:hypothetical protein
MVLVLTTQSGNPRAGIRFREARRAVVRYGVGGAMVAGIGDLSPHVLILFRVGTELTENDFCAR